MIVRDIIKMAYATGGLDRFLESCADEVKPVLKARLMEALNTTDKEIESDRNLAVVIPYGKNTVCMFREVFLERYKPSCQADLERLKEDISYEERCFLRQKVAPKLLLSHKALLAGPKFGPGAFKILLAAEVPHPMGVGLLGFVKTFLLQSSGFTLGMEGGETAIRVVDPIDHAILLERALAKAYAYYMGNREYDRKDMEFLKEVLQLPAVTPVMIVPKLPELTGQILDELLNFSRSHGKRSTIIKQSKLSSISPGSFRNEQLIVTDFACLLLDEEEERTMEKLIHQGVRLIVFSSADEMPVFASKELNDRFSIVHWISIDKER